jgi:peptidoglycan/LPS O-acetylase OafA/YrhL
MTEVEVPSSNPSSEPPPQGHGGFLQVATEVLTGGFKELRVATARRVPFLDFLRALAILLVINQHVSKKFEEMLGANRYTHFTLTRNGWIGVDLFFVLSGYFIGSQLWRELNTTATVSIKRFMIRRGLRIWPLYFFVFAILFVVTHGAPARQHGWTDLVFITNYTNHGIVDGSWSLCTEEQFYLLAPVALLLIGRRSMRGYRWGLAALLGLVVVVRILTYVHLTGHLFAKNADAFQHLYYPFHTHCDGLLAGLFVANLAAGHVKFKGFLSKPWVLALGGFIFFAVLNVVQSETLDFLGLAVFFGALVWWGLQMTTRRFDGHIFYLLSRLSFGMYLNHEYMQAWTVSHVAPLMHHLRLAPVLASVAAFLLLAFCSALLSVLTFCLVEHPFLMLRTAVLRRKVVSPLVAH